MRVIDVPLDELVEASWNSNVMPPSMMDRLKNSPKEFGLVMNLVARPVSDGYCEVLSGNQRLRVLREAGVESAPCVIVELSDAHARLLAQCLNSVQGEDDLGLKAELLQTVLEEIPEAEVLRLLPETSQGLTALASLGQQDLAGYLQNWQQSQSARLRRLTFQSTPAQLEVIEEALAQVLSQVSDADTNNPNPNPRGNALYLLCRSYLELTGRDS